MSSVNGSSLFQTTMPDTVNLYILSFLEVKDLLKSAPACRKFAILSADDQIWRLKTEAHFGKVAIGARQANKSWKKAYKDSIKKRAVHNAVTLAFGLPESAPNIDYYSTSRTNSSSSGTGQSRFSRAKTSCCVVS